MRLSVQYLVALVAYILSTSKLTLPQRYDTGKVVDLSTEASRAGVVIFNR